MGAATPDRHVADARGQRERGRQVALGGQDQEQHTHDPQRVRQGETSGSARLGEDAGHNRDPRGSQQRDLDAGEGPNQPQRTLRPVVDHGPGQVTGDYQPAAQHGGGRSGNAGCPALAELGGDGSAIQPDAGGRGYADHADEYQCPHVAW
jgi:hypothetical protein